MTLDPERRSATIALLRREPILRIDAVCKRFGSLAVLDGIDLTMRVGEVVAIVGPNGSGKSILLRCITQLEPPTSGRITLAGVSIEAGHAPTPTELAAVRRAVGMVFRTPNLFPHLTLLRNVGLAQERVLGRSHAEADARSLELLGRVGLADKAGQSPSRCSDGERQRVAIARALALEPQLMLFDEPTSALDPELGLEVLAVMRDLAEGGTTMIVVTHEIHFAETVADRVIVMADGRIVEQGPSRQVMREPQTERARRFLAAARDR